MGVFEGRLIGKRREKVVGSTMHELDVNRGHGKKRESERVGR